MKIYISNEGWELIESGIGCNAYPNKTAVNTPNEFISVKDVKELVSNAYEKGKEDGLNEETTAILTLYGLTEIKPK